MDHSACMYFYCCRHRFCHTSSCFFIRPATKPWPFAFFFHHCAREIYQSYHWPFDMSRVYKLLSTTARPSVTQVKPRPRILQRPFARNAPTRPKATEVTRAMCLNNSRKFRARVRFALGGTALFIRTSLEKTGLWHPLLNLLSSSVGVTAAKLFGMYPIQTPSL